MRRIDGSIGALTLAACGLLSSAAYGVSTNVTVNCPSDPSTYPTISAAVTASGAGGTITVCPGFYYENVVVTQNNLTIVAQKRGTAKLVGLAPANSSAPGVQLNASYDTISGLGIGGFEAGIYVGDGYGYETIQNDFITANIEGISFHNSLFNVVKGCQIWTNKDNGILDFFGLTLVSGGANQYVNDDVEYNLNNGIFINTSSPPCDYARASVTNTTSDNNQADGVNLTGSAWVTLNNNEFSYNGQDGVELFNSSYNTVKNTNADSNGANSASCGPAQGSGNCTGFRVHSDSIGNNIYDNSAHNNLVWDAQDNSSGSGTAGTGNKWNDDLCKYGSPSGICK